jgi:hypothetical protein
MKAGEHIRSISPGIRLNLPNIPAIPNEIDNAHVNPHVLGTTTPP